LGERSGSAGVPPAPGLGAGWTFRGYLPHYDRPGLIQMVTFGLADALPAAVLTKMKAESEARRDAEGLQRVQTLLDAGHGTCHLKDARIAELVQNAFFHFNGIRYQLLAWVVMLNHVHVLFETLAGFPASDIVGSWKSFTSKAANKVLGQTGQFWQRDYFDRAIRDEGHFAVAVE